MKEDMRRRNNEEEREMVGSWIRREGGCEGEERVWVRRG